MNELATFVRVENAGGYAAAGTTTYTGTTIQLTGFESIFYIVRLGTADGNTSFNIQGALDGATPSTFANVPHGSSDDDIVCFDVRRARTANEAKTVQARLTFARSGSNAEVLSVTALVYDRRKVSSPLVQPAGSTVYLFNAPDMDTSSDTPILP